MTKGIILPSVNAEALKPLTYQLPVGLIPIVNKPIIEHQVELLCSHDIKNIQISCNHLSNKVTSFFGDGARWGATISYNLERPPFGFVSALRQMASKIRNNTLIVFHSDVVTSLDITALLEYHRSKRADATFLCKKDLGVAPDYGVSLNEYGQLTHVGLGARGGLLADDGVFVLEAEILDLLPDNLGYNVLQACWLARQKLDLNFFGYMAEESVARISNWQQYYQVQSDVLEEKYHRIIIPGIQVKRGVWIGKNVSASSNISFDGPICIGDNCRIGKNVVLGKGTIIGHDVLVDVGATIERSVVCSTTFVGPGTSIADSVVIGNMMIELPVGNLVSIDDGLAASTIQQTSYGFHIYRFLNRVTALVLVIALMPFVAGLLTWLAVRLKFPLFSKHKRLAPDLGELANGSIRLRIVEMLYFGPSDSELRHVGHNPEPVTHLPGYLARIANIVNVMHGDILFVGNRPMDPEIAFGITEEWKRVRFKCQSGMASILDTYEGSRLATEDQAIAEADYASTRTFIEDIRIAFATIKSVFLVIIGKRVLRPAPKALPQEENIAFE